MLRRAGTIVGALLVTAACAAPGLADTIPVQLASSDAAPLQGEVVTFSVLDAVGPCPTYAWTVQGPIAERESFAQAPQIRLPDAGPYAVDVQIDDACDGSMRAGTLHFDAAVERLRRRLAVRYVYWTIADRLNIPRDRLNAYDQQFRVRARCSRRISRLAYACSFHGGCCEAFIRGRGRISYDPLGWGDRWRWRFRVAEGFLQFNGKHLRERVTRRRTWVGSAPR
jgi:hypothetical protein